MRTVLGYLWSLPMTLLGLLLMLVYIPKSIRWSEGCLEIIPVWILFSPGAQGHGCVIFYKNKEKRANRGLRVHERVHVCQVFQGGVFFGIAYVCDFLMHFLFNCPSMAELHAQYDWLPQTMPRWKRAYLAISFERTAYRIQDEFQRGLRPCAWGSRP